MKVGTFALNLGWVAIALAAGSESVFACYVMPTRIKAGSQDFFRNAPVIVGSGRISIKHGDKETYFSYDSAKKSWCKLQFDGSSDCGQSPRVIAGLAIVTKGDSVKISSQADLVPNTLTFKHSVQTRAEKGTKHRYNVLTVNGISNGAQTKSLEVSDRIFEPGEPQPKEALPKQVTGEADLLASDWEAKDCGVAVRKKASKKSAAAVVPSDALPADAPASPAALAH